MVEVDGSTISYSLSPYVHTGNKKIAYLWWANKLHYYFVSS
jgi:hypothetical protein